MDGVTHVILVPYLSGVPDDFDDDAELEAGGGTVDACLASLAMPRRKANTAADGTCRKNNFASALSQIRPKPLIWIRSFSCWTPCRYVS